jgi:hypothetical protein
MTSSDGSELKPVCVLDACTIINLACIDIESQNGFIIKKLVEYYCLNVTEKVMEESIKNGNLRAGKMSSLNDDSKKEIRKKIAYFWQFIKSNQSILKDLGKNFFTEVGNLTGYNKENGEFYSTALSLNLSRIHRMPVTFYTDDKPAERYFTSFFREQQVGKIEDSIDLLVFLYWLNPEFKKKDLDNILSELYSQYAAPVNELLSEVRKYKNSRRYTDLKKIRNLLDQLEPKLDGLNFGGIRELKKSILKHKKTHPELCNIIERYDEVFKLDAGQETGDFLNKIRKTRHNLKKDLLFKLDL